MLAVAAFFLGVSLGTWVSTGVLSKLGVTVGTLALLVMAGVMGLGQFIEATRYDRLDLMRISALGSTAFVITVLATITAHM